MFNLLEIRRSRERAGQRRCPEGAGAMASVGIGRGRPRWLPIIIFVSMLPQTARIILPRIVPSASIPARTREKRTLSRRAALAEAELPFRRLLGNRGRGSGGGGGGGGGGGDRWEKTVIAEDNSQFLRIGAEQTARTQEEIDAAIAAGLGAVETGSAPDGNGNTVEERNINISSQGDLAALSAGPVVRES
ncbi:hypothetical protein B0H14DRAFT_2559897 [Mycena olivaceomarginata]|nr:hypothetical protein B0H14DRAFT_2559897 [Mycena olivaceomarginata]